MHLSPAAKESPQGAGDRRAGSALARPLGGVARIPRARTGSRGAV